ncbi:MAG TPA: hypothetical protein VGD91_12460 [Trebonia sp.]
MDPWDERSDVGRRAASGLDGRRETRPGAVGGTAPSSRPAARALRGGRRRLVVAVTAVAAAVLVAGVATATVAVTRFHSGGGLASLSRSLSPPGVGPVVTAEANVMPRAAAGSCARPTVFSYSGTLSAVLPAVVTYRWIYSAGQPVPVQTVRFARAGHRVVAGRTVAARKAGGGWAELKVLSPVRRTSNKAAYRLLCGGGTAGGTSITAALPSP